MNKHGGKRIGAGRKPKRVEQDEVAFMDRCLPLEKREKIVQHMYEIATGDNAKAAVTAGSLLLAYTVGKPVERHEHSGESGGPIQLKVIYADS